MSHANLKPDTVSLEIFSNGSTNVSPSVLIRTPTNVYLFNCPEGTSRFIPQLKIRPQTIQDFFITRGSWECFGGLFGILSEKTENHVTRLHGPSNLKHFSACVRPYIDHNVILDKKTAYQLEECTTINGKYEDNAFVIHYIPISENNSCDISYLLELKEPNKRIDLTKIIAKNVPNGPLIGKLKSGQTILLEDGTKIEPEDVYADDSEDYRSNVLIVDCESVSKFESLTTSNILKSYTDGTRQLGYIVHFTADRVLKHISYQEWMKSFGSPCLHLIVNGTGEALPLTDGLYRQHRMLNEICPDLFPPIFLNNFCKNIFQTVNMPSMSIVHARNMEKYPMRSKNLSAINDSISIMLESSELEERINQNESIQETIKQFRESRIDLSDDQYPSVAFLGTVSATSIKYRNVSGHLLQLNAKTSILIDCGEGTFGQLRSIFSPDRIDDILLSLKAVFITHAHYDHIGGLITVIERRVEAFENKGQKYVPFIVVCNLRVQMMLDVYGEKFKDISSCIEFVKLNLQYISLPEDFNKFAKHELHADITTKLPLLNEWNLNKVITVQVPHSKMASAFIFDTCDGERIVFSGDTMPSDLLAELGKNADLLIHEATFEDGFEENAKFNKHCTTGQALGVAQKMKAKMTILTHFSARYPRIPLISESVLSAKNVGIAFDNMVVPLNKCHLLPLLLPVFINLFE